MISRGEVGLIIAAVGIEQGLIQQSVFSAIVGVVILTTVLTPLLLSALTQRVKKPKQICRIHTKELDDELPGCLDCE